MADDRERNPTRPSESPRHEHRGPARRRSGRTHELGSGSTILVFGILGLVMCGIFAPIAWIQGNQHIQRARILGVPPEGAATAGRILGIVGTVLIGLSLVAFGIMIAAGVFAIPVLHGG